MSKLGQFRLKEPNHEHVFWEYSALADSENQKKNEECAKGKVRIVVFKCSCFSSICLRQGSC